MPKYDPKVQAAADARFAAYEARKATIRERIREILRAGRVPLGALPTAGAIMYALRDFEGDLVHRVLMGMCGTRVGAETTGEVVIAGYSCGSEVFGLRRVAGG